MPKSSRVALAGMCLGIVALTGCAAPDTHADDRPLVLTTFTVIEDIAQNVAGEHLTVESITKIGAEIHGYEPTPGDIRRAHGADLILDNGLGLEAWFEQFVADVDAPHVVVSEGVDAIPITADAYAGRDNPHAWMSPLNAQLYVDNIVAAFSDLDPQNASAFEENGAEYKIRLQQIEDRLVAELGALPVEQRALVTCEGAFSYLARDAGLTEAYLWAVNAEQQATPRQIADTIEFVEGNDVRAVFCESTVSDAAMQRVVDATGAEFGGVLYVDSLSAVDGPVPTYLDLIEHDVDTILAGLTGTG
ncbi:metal ABC transporter substrate-binding protein [Microbacterium sp. CPCC 204701]|uniref:metal ABC transporter substrate-binding protein n=1 Tax=Microbacterium sp. CPCC 204701 TaxID=2493084 RepID=UPI000FDCA023